MRNGLHMAMRALMPLPGLPNVEGYLLGQGLEGKGMVCLASEEARSHMQRLDKQDAHEAQLPAAELGVAQGALDSSTRGGSLGSRGRHQVLEDGVKGEDVAAGRDLGADGWAVQGDRAAQWRRCQHLHLHPQIEGVETGRRRQGCRV